MGFADLVNVDAYKNKPRSGPPLWQRKPNLLGDLVDSVMEVGRYDIAADNNMVGREQVHNWLRQGKIQADIADEHDEDYTPLAQFYREMTRAASLHLTHRLKTIQQLADSGDPEYKNFSLWLAQNMDAERRFAPNMRIESNSTETKEVTITVKYADGKEWTSGGRVQSIEGEVVDTEMKQIESGDTPTEDF